MARAAQGIGGARPSSRAQPGGCVAPVVFLPDHLGRGFGPARFSPGSGGPSTCGANLQAERPERRMGHPSAANRTANRMRHIPATSVALDPSPTPEVCR